jgi:two-component system nitrogen regulation sensor histidine kinase GlnL
VVELLAVDRLLKISREESFLHAQETNRAVIRGLAHEIKNPLGGVRGAAQLLARELPNEELAEYTRIIIREADRLRDLVDRLLGPNRQLDLRPLNIHEILEHVRNLIAAESDNRVTIARDYDPSLPEIPCDRAQLIQAVLNIMRNALQAAKDPGECEIILRSRSQRQFTVGAQVHRLMCRVDIIDNGPGIPAALQSSVFAPMVTGRAGGTGLGLSIAQSIIHLHGGVLECESRPGETRFTFYLPMEIHHA